ncbi:MAG TPA: M1 family aminopeptidase [Acidobacteriota bacterium]|nr:M1 family aminopeptidase [Acidobacteriota bacterium]
MKKRVLNWLLLLTLTAAAGAQGWAQPQADVEPGRIDVLNYDVRARILPDRAALEGSVAVRFQVLEDALSVPFQLNSRLVLTNVRSDEKRYNSRYTDFGTDQFLVRGDDPFIGGQQYVLTFDFEGTLENEQYAFLDTPERSPVFINRNGAVLLSQGHWFPSHNLPLDSAPASIRIQVPLGFTVVGPGQLQPIETEGIEEVFTWVSQRPLGEMPVVVARFVREPFDLDPVPLTFFVADDFEGELEPLAQETSRIIEFYRSRYGPVDLQRLNLAQVGNVDLSGKGSLGLILLESDLMRGGDLPRQALATRLALQWWGYSTELESYRDAWLRDGFATYAALQYVRSQDEEQYKTDLAMTSVDALKYEDRSPVMEGLSLDPGTAQYQSIVASKGAWVLYMLSQLTGEEAFQSILSDWFSQIKGGKASTAAFRQLVEERTGTDYGWFFLQWIEQVGVPEFEVDYTIYKRRDGSFRIEGQVKQDLDLFQMPVDILIETKGQAEEKRLEVKGRSTSFNFMTETLPERLRFDPKGKILLDSELQRLRVHIALGDEFLRQGEFVAAITEYEKAKSEDPRSSLVHYRLGEVYFRQQSYNLAANSFRDALNGDLQPDWVETWTHIYLGKIFDVLGQRQRALAEYQKAVNSGVDYNGAQAEAQKYIKSPYSKPSNFIE